MTLIVNQERSAGRRIVWREIAYPKNLGRAFVSDQSKCTVVVQHTAQLGWHISVAHPFRYPSWDEIAAARYALVPDDACMAMMLPPEAEYVNLHPNCFHLHECRCDRGEQ